MRERVVLDLCAGSGMWSKPYEEAGYDVRRYDLDNDVRLLGYDGSRAWGILAAPPCTVFASSGARWPRTDAEYREALSIVDACLRAVVLYRPRWWALENPIGKLKRWLGPPPFYFHPCQYGDPYTKKTALWGVFTPPAKHPVEPTLGGMIHRMAPSPERAARRSVTPGGFARAFFEANP